MTLAAGPISDKLCFVYCGDDRCNCRASEVRRRVYYPPVEPETPPEPEYAFKIGDKVIKHTGDYHIYGEVRGYAITKAGKIRYVVEHDAVPEGSFLHIYSESNLKLI